MSFDFTLEPGRKNKNQYRLQGDEAKISVITPYYNAQKHILQTAYAVLNQTFPWFEWIIVNDGSNHSGETEMLAKIASLDSRITVINQENAGGTAARNRGILESKTELIFFIDADDLIDECYLEYAYCSLMCNPEAQWAYADSLGFQDMEYLWIKEFSSDVMKQENVLPYCALIRRCIFFNQDMYPNESKNMWEDYQLWLRLLAQRAFPVHISQIMFWYRRQETGELAKIEKHPEEKKALEKKIERLKQKVPDGIKAKTFGGKMDEEFVKPRIWADEKEFPFLQKKIQILMLVPHMECGGADIFNLDIVKHINKDIFEVGIIATTSAVNEWQQEFKKYTDNVFDLPSFLDINDWASFIHYYIKTRGVQIVLNMSSYYGYYMLPWLRIEFPELAIIDCVHAEGKYWRSGGYPRISAALDSVLDKTLATNEFAKTVMVESYGKEEEKIKVVYTGVDENKFDPFKYNKAELKKKYGVQGRPTVLFLCRIAAEKRPFLMLEIAARVKEEVPDVCFLVVGTGPQVEELQKKSLTMNLDKTVSFFGRVEDTREFYAIADLFLLCSIKEGLSITTIESMLMKVPVVSANVGSQSEIINEKTGVLIDCIQDEAADFDARSFPAEEIGLYWEAIVRLLTDHNSRMKIAENCRKVALKNLTLSSLLETLESEFQELCEKKVKEEREKLSSAMNPYRNIFVEFITLYQAYEGKDIVASEIWAAREWYKELYEKASEKKVIAIQDEKPDNVIYNGEESAERKLQQIYQMRSWKLIQKYRYIMDHTIIGKGLRKIVDIFLK